CLLVVGQEFLDLGAQGRVIAACRVEEDRPLGRGPLLRLVEELAQPLIALRIHRIVPPPAGCAGRLLPCGSRSPPCSPKSPAARRSPPPCSHRRSAGRQFGSAARARRPSSQGPRALPGHPAFAAPSSPAPRPRGPAPAHRRAYPQPAG